MKTKTRTLSIALAAALVGTLAFPAPQARADNDKALVAAGALIGGLLGYIASEADRDYRPAPVCRPVVVQHRPVVVVEPCRPQPPRPVVVHADRHGKRRVPAVVRRDYGTKHGSRRGRPQRHGRR